MPGFGTIMADAPLTLDDSILSRNLDALRKVDVPLADRLAGLDPADGHPRLLRTRDGQTNFRLSSPDGHEYWLGWTSIPAVRAGALIEQFNPGDGNILLPGVGEGTEIAILLTKLKQDRRVFVWEPDGMAVRLALALRDYAVNLSTGRLVLLAGPLAELSSMLAAWLHRHPGVAFPTRMMMLPWHTPAETAEIRSAVEAALSRMASTSATNSAQ